MIFPPLVKIVYYSDTALSSTVPADKTFILNEAERGLIVLSVCSFVTPSVTPAIHHSYEVQFDFPVIGWGVRGRGRWVWPRIISS